MLRQNVSRERHRTRDLLLEYDHAIMPPHPRAGGLHVVYPWGNNSRYHDGDDIADLPLNPNDTNMDMIYPWENITNAALAQQIYAIAQKYGYNSTLQQFWIKFSNTSVVYGTLATFPNPGAEDYLYMDTETDILYYFKSTTKIVNKEAAARVGIAIIGNSRVNRDGAKITDMYIPVRSLLIEDTILSEGDASEYID